MLLIDQLEVFLWTLLAGMLAGMFHVIYRVVSDTLKLKRIGTFAGDIIFWLFLTAIAFLILLKANYGQLRLYVFIGLFLGAFLFTRCLGNYFYRLLRWLLYIAGKVLRLLALTICYIWKAFTFPFRVVLMIVIFPLRIFKRIFNGVGRWAGGVISRSTGKISSRLTGVLKRLVPRR